MDYRKVVNITTELTSTTALIDDPNDYQVSDVVTRYTKPVYVIGGAPSEPLTVANGQGANLVGSNAYVVGKTVEGRTAAYTGGVDPVTYRYRFQFKATGSDTWVNESWTNTTNAKNSVTYTLTETGQIKLQSQARDSSDPVVQLNSTTGIKTVEGIGDITATVNGNPYDLVAAPTITVESGSVNALTVQKSGNVSVTYNWTMRSGVSAVISSPVTANTDITIATAGVATAQCAIQSLGEIKQVDIQFFVV